MKFSKVLLLCLVGAVLLSLVAAGDISKEEKDAEKEAEKAEKEAEKAEKKAEKKAKKEKNDDTNNEGDLSDGPSCIKYKDLRENHVPLCDSGESFAAKITGPDCTWECYKFNSGAKHIYKRLREARVCDEKRNKKMFEKTYWECERFTQLAGRYTCKLPDPSDTSKYRLCLNSALAVEVMNDVAKHCFDDYKPTDDMEPQEGTGILRCMSENTLPDFQASSKLARVEPNEEGLVQMTDAHEARIARMKKRSLKAKSFAAGTVSTDVSGRWYWDQCDYSNSICMGHHFEPDLKVNDNCTGVCVSNRCNYQDFLLLQCFRYTARTGLTMKTCHRNAVTRFQCFREFSYYFY